MSLPPCLVDLVHFEARLSLVTESLLLLQFCVVFVLICDKMLLFSPDWLPAHDSTSDTMASYDTKLRVVNTFWKQVLYQVKDCKYFLSAYDSLSFKKLE